MKRLWCGWLALVVLAACTSTPPTPLPVATQTLIRAPSTPTPTEPPPTRTPPPLAAPAEVAATSPPAAAFSIPAAAQPPVQQAINHLADRLGIDAATIDLVRIDAATWSAVDLGCGDNPMPDPSATEIDGYRVVLVADGATYPYHTDTNDRVRLCPESDTPDTAATAEATADSGDPELILADPVAAELVALAQRRLAADLDLSVRRMRLVDVVPVTWPDTSLGCPAADQTYTERAIPGYRIVLAAGSTEYVFHTDFERAVPCPAGSEVLPGAG